MSHPNFPLRLRLFSALAGALLFTAAGWAQGPTPAASATNQWPRLTATLQPGETVGQEQVLRELLRSGTNEFLFVVPNGTQTETAPDGKIILSSWQQRFYVAIRLLEPPATTLGLKEALRARLTREYAHATSVEEFDTTVAGHPGSGFQLRLEQSNAGSRLIRRVYVPFHAGLLELTLDADAKSAALGQQAFDQVQLTLRSNEQGQLEVRRRSDQT